MFVPFPLQRGWCVWGQMGCAEGITRERERERGGGVGVERESELWKKLAADELTSFVECPLAAIPASVSAMDAVDPTRRAMHNDTSGAMIWYLGHRFSQFNFFAEAIKKKFKK